MLAPLPDGTLKLKVAQLLRIDFDNCNLISIFATDYGNRDTRTRVP